MTVVGSATLLASVANEEIIPIVRRDTSTFFVLSGSQIEIIIY